MVSCHRRLSIHGGTRGPKSLAGSRPITTDQVVAASSTLEQPRQPPLQKWCNRRLRGIAVCRNGRLPHHRQSSIARRLFSLPDSLEPSHENSLAHRVPKNRSRSSGQVQEAQTASLSCSCLLPLLLDCPAPC